MKMNVEEEEEGEEGGGGGGRDSDAAGDARLAHLTSSHTLSRTRSATRDE